MALSTTITTELIALKIECVTKEAIQVKELELNSQYKHIPQELDANSEEYSMTEYICPDGKVGYDIIFYKVIDGIDYIMTIGYGEESLQRSHAWREVINVEKEIIKEIIK